jgi:cyanophycinase
MSTLGSLVLAGGSAWNGAALGSLTESRGVLVLPTAAAFEHWEEAVAVLGRSWFDVGFGVEALPILMRHDAESAAHAERVRGAGIIAVIGESSLHARAVVAETPVWAAVLDAWHNGATLVGVGGGAALLGDPMVDPRGGAFTVGLGVVPGVAVLPHADQGGVDRTRRTLRMASGKHLVLALNSDSAAVWSSLTGWTLDPGAVVHGGGSEISGRAADQGAARLPALAPVG